jgi:hypothetical protein
MALHGRTPGKGPAGFKLMPHFHPDEWRTGVVLSGTYYFAVGEQWDETKLKPYPASRGHILFRAKRHAALCLVTLIRSNNCAGEQRQRNAARSVSVKTLTVRWKRLGAERGGAQAGRDLDAT